MKQSPFLLGKEGKPKQIRAGVALNFSVLQPRPILTSRNHDIDQSDLEPALSFKLSRTYKRMLEDMKLDSAYKSATAGQSSAGYSSKREGERNAPAFTGHARVPKQPIVTYSNVKRTEGQSKELASVPSAKAKSARQSKLKQRGAD